MIVFGLPEVLWGLLFVPIAYYIYRRVTKRKKKEALKFSNVSFIKSALGNKTKS
ncbi:BatA domain-containing protein, partial [Candidatus Woesearchaeota archaeon]|nr:BatA domain-containing protein [Candidatus Woesearchaeota archaeon]